MSAAMISASARCSTMGKSSRSLTMPMFIMQWVPRQTMTLWYAHAGGVTGNTLASLQVLDFRTGVTIPSEKHLSWHTVKFYIKKIQELLTYNSSQTAHLWPYASISEEFQRWKYEMDATKLCLKIEIGELSVKKVCLKDYTEMFQTRNYSGVGQKQRSCQVCSKGIKEWETKETMHLIQNLPLLKRFNSIQLKLVSWHTFMDLDNVNHSLDYNSS